MASWFELAGISAQEFSANGVRTFAIVEGRNLFPLILLHGTPGASFIWDPLIRAVGRDRKIIAPDLPGWGRSVSKYEKPIPLTKENMMLWFRAVLEAQEVERFDLVAHGNAALLAGEFLVSEPQRVRRLGLIAAGLDKIAGDSLLARIWRRKSWSQAELRRWIEREAKLNETGRKFMPLFEELFEQNLATAQPKFNEREFAGRLDTHQDAIAQFKGAKLIIESETGGYFPMLDKPAEVAEQFADFLRD